MNYLEIQRKKSIDYRDSLFRDPGGGVYRGKPRDFVLSDSSLNLWCGIREDAIQYFKRNKIVWWDGNDIPTGHLLSSQIACVNHLYPIRQRLDLASKVLQTISPEFESADILDDGFVEFETIGKENYLGEKSHQRGANSTSIDAMMVGKKSDGTRVLVGIEWKYTESYPSYSKYIPARADIYDPLIQTDTSPLRVEDASSLYYEPFYQLMRQSLLLSIMAEQKEYGCNDFIHLHVIPAANSKLRESVTSPKLTGTNLTTAWQGVLKDRSKYIVISPDELLAPLEHGCDSKSLFEYLRLRYWD